MKSNFAIILVLVIIVLLLWAISGYLIWQNYPSMAERGQFGDMFGAINALFSGFALAGIVGAIFLQGRELSLQRTELKLQREEMARSAAAEEKSARLNAMSTLAQTYTDMSLATGRGDRPLLGDKYDGKRDDALKNIEEELQEMTTSTAQGESENTNT